MKIRALFTLCSLAVICTFSHLDGLVIETNDLAHAFTYLKEDTLYVFDLDNTLIQTAQHLGSDEWFTHKVDHMTKEGKSLTEALRHVNSLYAKIIDHTEMRLVDPCIPELLHNMQKKHVPMIGLTKRNPTYANRTLQQVASLHIDFTKTCHFKEEIVFEELAGTLYKDGIIFSGPRMEKGPCLLAYLKKLDKMPKQIVMIDDKMSYVKNIAETIEPLGISFIGIRYGGADEKVKAYNPRIAEIQLEHFQKILTDEQALHLMQLNKGL